MFSVALEFRLPQLMSMRRSVFGFGGAEVGLTLVAGMLAAVLGGATWREGVVVGGVLAMSSTAIISKMLAERMQLHTDWGRQVMGVLLFQDLAVIPLLVLIPALALTRAEIASTVGVALVKAAVGLAVVLWLGPMLMRRLFGIVSAITAL